MKRLYEGPDGVFYDPKHDEVFILDWTGAEWFNRKTRKFNGRVYRYASKSFKSKKAGVIMADWCVRLGPL